MFKLARLLDADQTDGLSAGHDTVGCRGRVCDTELGLYFLRYYGFPGKGIVISGVCWVLFFDSSYLDSSKARTCCLSSIVARDVSKQ